MTPTQCAIRANLDGMVDRLKDFTVENAILGFNEHQMIEFLMLLKTDVGLSQMVRRRIYVFAGYTSTRSNISASANDKRAYSLQRALGPKFMPAYIAEQIRNHLSERVTKALTQ